MLPEGLEQVLELRPQPGDPGERVLLLEGFQACEGDGAAERVRGVAMPVIERLALLGFSEERFVDLGEASVAAIGRYPPVRPFASAMRSGTTPSFWQANIAPVRPKPVITSSRISQMPRARQSSATPRSQPSG